MGALGTVGLCVVCIVPTSRAAEGFYHTRIRALIPRLALGAGGAGIGGVVPLGTEYRGDGSVQALVTPWTGQTGGSTTQRIVTTSTCRL